MQVNLDWSVLYMFLKQATAKALPRMDDDDRLKPLLNNISKQYLGKEYGNKDGDGSGIGNIAATDVDQVRC